MKNLALILSLLFSVACHNADKELYEGMDTDTGMLFEEVVESTEVQQSAPLSKTESDQVTKKVVKTGGIDFQSENIVQDYRKIYELLPQFNAYIENENQNNSEQRISYQLTIRVPADVYDSLYESLSSISRRVDNRYSNVEDVTERYYDLQTRIKNKKALEQRYVELLDKAIDVKDILEIEKNLNQVRTDIENLQGQFNYLSKQVNFSTINLSFYEILPYVYDSSQRRGFGARILSALDNGWQGFLSFLIGLMTIWPFILLVMVSTYLLLKLKSRWKKKKSD